MQNTNIPFQTVQTKDINNVEHLPTIKVGIRDEYVPEKSNDKETEYLDLRTSKLDEAYERDDSSVVKQTVKHILNGGDYHTELDALHKHVKPYLHDTNTSNAQDNYIHEVLKRGKPNGETVAHIHEVIHRSTYPSYVENMYNTNYLSDKWEPFLDAHAKKKQSIFKKEDSIYKPEEINNISSKFEVKGLRLLRHASSGHYYELHPTEGLKYVGNRFQSRYFSSDEEQSNHVLDKILSSENTTPTTSEPDVRSYTDDSSSVNRYLHKKYADPSHVTNAENIKKIESVSKHFEEAHPTPHLPDFHVYTGVYGELNPRIHSSHRDEHGNYVFHNPSFTSTSIDAHTAEYFAKTKNEPKYVSFDDPYMNHPIADVLKIRIPAGYPHGSYIKPFSTHDSENEFLLDKGHTFVLNPTPIHYATKNKIIRQWTAELHPKDVNESVPFENRPRNEKIDTIMHPDVKSEDIEKAARDDDFSVRAVAARHPRVHPETLKTLAEDQMPRVRIAAMMNDHTPNDLMEKSIKDYSSALGIARRKTVPEHLMPHLINHDFSSVGEAVALRPDLKDDHILQLLTTPDPDHKIQGALASNPTVHPDVLHALHKHPEDSVRLNLAKNPNLAPHTVSAMQHDSEYVIRSALNSTHGKKTKMA